MQTLRTFVLTFALTHLAPVAWAEPVREIHLGISPFLSVPQRDQLMRSLPAWLLDKNATPAQSRVIVWDAWRLTVVAEITIPMLDVDTPRARAPRLAPVLGQVGIWLRTDTSIPNGIDAGSGAVLAPQWIHEASAAPASVPRTLILVGSPLYRSRSEPAFDMGDDARYPSDGMLAGGLRDSVFGLAEKAGRLDRAILHWCYLDQSPWENELHRQCVTRFWTLFVGGQGGTLATFGADLPAALGRATRTDLPAVLSAQRDPADDKPTMHSARPRTLPVWLDPAAVEPVAPPPPPVEAVATPAPTSAPVVESTFVSVPPPAPEPVREPEPAVAGPVATPPPPPLPAFIDNTKTGIGIAWSARGVDLDLYVRAFPEAKELYFRENRSHEGKLHRDERNANAGRFFEFVEFTGPVDLTRMTVWINYYAGRAAGVSGQIVLFDRGRIKTGTFSLRATRGNAATDRNRRASSAYWTEIKLSDLTDSTQPLAAKKPGEN